MKKIEDIAPGDRVAIDLECTDWLSDNRIVGDDGTGYYTVRKKYSSGTFDTEELMGGETYHWKFRIDSPPIIDLLSPEEFEAIVVLREDMVDKNPFLCGF